MGCMAAVTELLTHVALRNPAGFADWVDTNYGPEKSFEVEKGEHFVLALLN